MTAKSTAERRLIRRAYDRPVSSPAHLQQRRRRARRLCGSLRDVTSGRNPGLPGSSIVMATRSEGLDVRRSTILAALGTALAASFAASAAPANAAVSSASISGTTATLNLDGADDNVTVSVSGGLLVHGLRPGPELFRTAPDVPYAFIIHMLITALALPLFGGLLAIRVFGQALRLPPALLAAPILILATVGSYSVHSSAFDVWMMLAFGLLGFVMDRYGWPTAPLVLGVIIGPMAEQNLRLALGINLGNPNILWQSWISVILIVTAFAALLWPVVQKRRRAARQT